MCDCYQPCKCLKPTYIVSKPLSTLLLDCWQREYDVRPYQDFIFDRLEFEQRLGRAFHEVYDFGVLVEFLNRRALNSVKLRGLRIVAYPPDLLENFVNALQQVTSITLHLMELPNLFFQLLLKNSHNLLVKHLSFEGSVLKPKILPLLQEFLIKCDTLESVNLNHCSILQYDFALLVDGVYKSSRIAKFRCSRLLGGTLTLESQKIMHILSQIVWQNRLTELETQHNELTAQDMETLAEYLSSRLCRLRNLNVAYNIIGPDGALHLLSAISYSSTLTHLNMCGNELGTHGGEHVADYLSACASLQYLNIRDNKIGVVAVNRLFTALKKPIMLARLELWGNNFDNYSAMVLKRLLQSRVLLQSAIDVTVTNDEEDNKYRIIPFIEWNPSNEWKPIINMKRKGRKLEKEKKACFPRKY